MLPRPFAPGVRDCLPPRPLLAPPALPAQETRWKTYNDAVIEAYQRGDYPEAEKQFLAALKEAEGFGPQDSRLATSLSNLTVVYRAQQKYAEAEPLYKRSLTVRERALGPDHSDVAAVLENYAALLRKMKLETEAEKMDARAKAIRAKQARNNSPKLTGDERAEMTAPGGVCGTQT